MTFAVQPFGDSAMTLPLPTAVQSGLIPAMSLLGRYGSPRLANVLPAPVHDVRPHCQRPVAVYRFSTEQFINCTYHCAQHDDVAPIHRAEARPDWSAA